MCELGMPALIRGNAPDLGDRGEEGATHRAGAVTVDSPRGSIQSVLGPKLWREKEKNKKKKRGVEGGSPSMEEL